MFLGAVASLAAADRPLVGYVSDEKCAVSGAKAKSAAEWIKPAAFESCVKDCVKAGSAAVFVTEDNKILKFSADSKDKVTPLLGHKVSIVGKVQGSTVTVESIKGLELK
jgi:hypothetical protein